MSPDSLAPDESVRCFSLWTSLCGVSLSGRVRQCLSLDESGRCLFLSLDESGRCLFPDESGRCLSLDVSGQYLCPDGSLSLDASGRCLSLGGIYHVTGRKLISDIILFPSSLLFEAKAF